MAVVTALTYLALCQRLVSETKIPGSGPTTTVSQTGINKNVVQWINQAYIDIQDFYPDWNFRWYDGLISCTTGDYDYDESANCETFNRKSFEIYDSSDDATGASASKMSWIPWKLWRYKYAQRPQTNGDPSNVTIAPDGQVHIYPPPDSDDWRVRYSGFMPIDELSGDADVPILPNRYHMLIVYKAMLDYAHFYIDQSNLARVQIQYSDLLSRMVSDQKVEIYTRKRGVEGNASKPDSRIG